MLTFLQKVISTIQRRNLLTSGDNVLVAVSAGADSVALARVLTEIASQYQLSIELAHLNHGLRGAEADADARFVEDLGVQFGWRTHLGYANVRTLAQQYKQSLEEAGREARYTFFERIAKQINASKIATAHTANDQAEVVLMRWLRGAGVRGLAGIPYCRGNIIRPFLDIMRQDILDYLLQTKQAYREDQSNADQAFMRNRIRHRLLPALEREFYPGITRRLNQSAILFRSLEDYLSQQVALAASQLCLVESNDKIKLALTHFFDYPEILRLELIRWCIEKLCNGLPDWSFSNYQSCHELAAQSQSGQSCDLPDGICVQRTHHYLIFERKRPVVSATFCYNLPIPGMLEIPEIGWRLFMQLSSEFDVQGYPKNSEQTIWVDFDLLPKPLFVRNRKPGDRLHIPAVGTKKVQDILIDEKFPRESRSRLPLIYAGDELLWVVSIRRSGLAKVTTQTKRVLKISVEKNIPD